MMSLTFPQVGRFAAREKLACVSCESPFVRVLSHFSFGQRLIRSGQLLRVRVTVTIQSEHSTRYYSARIYSYITPYLQRVLEELVHLGDLGRDGKVDGAVTNLNNEATTDLRVDLRAIVSKKTTFSPALR